MANLVGGFSLPALAAQISAALQASFGASLPEAVAAFTGGLNGLVQAGQTLAANLAGSLGGGFNALIEVGQALAANLVGGFSLPALAAQISAALQASFGASFPEAVAAFTGGLNGLVQAGQTLAANLAGSLGGGFNALIEVGQALAANLVGGFSLPALAAQISAALQASFGASLPEAVAAFTGGLNGLVQAGQALAAQISAALQASFGASLPEAVAAFTGGLNGLVQAGQTLAANLAGSLGGGFNALVEVGQALAANLVGGFSLPALAAQISAALQASFGASFPEAVAAFTGGLNGLLQAGQTLAANLAGSFGGGLSGLLEAGQVLMANLVGGFSLPARPEWVVGGRAGVDGQPGWRVQSAGTGGPDQCGVAGQLRCVVPGGGGRVHRWVERAGAGRPKLGGQSGGQPWWRV
ncbi:methyl-accepting chemotaxis protein [Mycobacterium marinum]|uniref:methyl-accepting chemotaxis protein n=1 Tax=Mycobacterium marinum TaxID=1781 RepID=UPI001AA07579|nr:methyl-accepting chemotaxis protein [Mycobacterium marinum]